MQSKLTIFNGSPRNKRSNSKVLIEHFLRGYNEVEDKSISIYYLAEVNKAEAFKKAFLEAETIIIIFPLYTDSMPGIVKRFFEDIVALEMKQPKKIGFIVQSGFPEAIHSIYVERYLRKLISRMNCIYLGTVIKGGVEGIQIMPPSLTKKLFQKFKELGKHFAREDEFDDNIVAQLKTPFKLSKQRKTFLELLSLTGITNFYWNSHLKKNKAYQNRFDRPYIA